MISVILIGHDNTRVTIFAPPLECWDEGTLTKRIRELESEWRVGQTLHDCEDVNTFAEYLCNHGFMKTSEEILTYRLG